MKREFYSGSVVYVRSHRKEGEAAYPQVKVTYIDSTGEVETALCWAAVYRVGPIIVNKFGSGVFPRIELHKASETYDGPNKRTPRITILTASDEDAIPVEHVIKAELIEKK